MPGPSPSAHNAFPALLQELLRRVLALEVWTRGLLNSKGTTLIARDALGNATAIMGYLEQELQVGWNGEGERPKPTPTGLTGTGLASYKTGHWVQL
jgi:hypothetical protein